MNTYIEKDQVDNMDEKFSDSDIKIVPYEKNKLKHSFYIHKTFFPYIVGSKNNVRQKIQIETKTSIEVPKIGQDGNIVIIGSDRKDILSARHRIDIIVEASRKNIRYTHFLSIPLNVQGIIENFNLFKSNVIQKYGGIATGIEEILFQKPYKLHLTLGMLTLLDEGEIKQAVQTLMDCKQHVIEPFIEKHGLFTIEIKGVDCMNDDPSAVKILYGIVFTENDALQELSNRIVDYFAEKEIMPKRINDVKLHATFMNVSYRRKIKNFTTVRNMYKSFDATQIINEYKGTLFGKTVLKEVHLSRLIRSTPSQMNYYEAAGKITLSEEQQ
ncbi:activating signal cointegrator 1 complex subunit 1-like isoform X1 [Polistes fuscatus]|uniref:activating signal cointegrator 1 complex subunit 1-like isoform X1 n=1 Tax=Polistes fuscatus TaxID=30207 RepID=UPI001CAA1059|nr:activating signal cointegrator 1 complex subunit 1-like isoform X1 [Polistes fuscatus]XP_043496179.1 activating signal cointegrator 1 complex subunit 1-like isoform X1 [Polistes fuscatus]